VTVRFAETFARLSREGSCGLFPYLTAGYPDVPTSRVLAEAALDAGADGFEIGVPFSDPLADGATLQRANARALAGGATVDTALELAEVIRRRSPQTPIALMSYYNPLWQRGDREIAADLSRVQADAAIVPDLPAEESASLRGALLDRNLSLIPLLAPTSPARRIQAVAALEPAWIYCVALVGVTGARRDVSEALGSFLSAVRAATPAPLVVGFGISQPDHVRRAASSGASAVIVASALTDLVDRSADPIQAARTYLTQMKQSTSAVAS
jgi:tryptophan synthase alpha chain